VFGQASRAILRAHALSVPERFVASQSYAELSSFASCTRGALVIGLRGVHANSAFLTELGVNGTAVSRLSEPPYPLSLRMSLLLRLDDPLAVPLAHRFMDSVLENACEDRTEAEVIGAITILRARLCAFSEVAAGLNVALAI
jgi:hypothetical protein